MGAEWCINGMSFFTCLCRKREKENLYVISGCSRQPNSTHRINYCEETRNWRYLNNMVTTQFIIPSSKHMQNSSFVNFPLYAFGCSSISYFCKSWKREYIRFVRSRYLVVQFSTQRTSPSPSLFERIDSTQWSKHFSTIWFPILLINHHFYPYLATDFVSRRRSLASISSFFPVLIAIKMFWNSS